MVPRNSNSGNINNDIPRNPRNSNSGNINNDTIPVNIPQRFLLQQYIFFSVEPITTVYSSISRLMY